MIYCARCGKLVNTIFAVNEWEASNKFVEETYFCEECGLFLYRTLEETEYEC